MSSDNNKHDTFSLALYIVFTSIGGSSFNCIFTEFVAAKDFIRNCSQGGNFRGFSSVYYSPALPGHREAFLKATFAEDRKNINNVAEFSRRVRADGGDVRFVPDPEALLTAISHKKADQLNKDEKNFLMCQPQINIL